MSAGALGCDAALGPGASLQRGRCRSTGGTDECAETSPSLRYFLWPLDGDRAAVRKSGSAGGRRVDFKVPTCESRK